MVLFPWVSLVQPLYIPYLSLVHPFYSHRDFGSLPVFPPSPGLILTALVWPLFEGNHIVVRLQFPTAISSPFLPLDFGLWTLGFGLAARSAPPRPAHIPLPAKPPYCTLL
jgi:hypothetical protein